MILLNIGDWFAQTAFSGSLIAALPIALIAGLVSFLSPCVVPLLPGYFSYVTGMAASDVTSGSRRRMLAGSALFVLGFSTVFLSVGALFGQLGSDLFAYRRPLSVILGTFTIVVGLSFAGWIPWFNRDIRFHRVPAVGLLAAPMLGFLFGLGWTPCLGPTLSVVASLAISEGTAWRGTILAAAYCAGLGIPFMVFAVLWRRMIRATRWLRSNGRLISRIGGILLISVGVLLVTGLWDVFVGYLRTAFPATTSVV